MQFNKEIEVQTLLKRNQQSKCKQQSGNSSLTNREEIQSTAQEVSRYDKKFQDLVEEVNTKRRLGCKIIEDSDQPNKLKVLYQQTVNFLEEKIPK